MRILLILIFISNLSKIFAQPGLSEKSLQSGIVNPLDVSGRVIMAAKRNGIEGSPMINENFVRGSVTLKNGQKFNLERLNYSPFDKQVYFQIDSTDLIFYIPVKEFILNNSDAEGSPVYYKSGYPPIDGNTEESLYVVLSSGPELELLKFQEKSIVEHYQYGSAIEKRYALKERLYIYDIKSKTLVLPGRNVTSFKRALPNYGKAIDSFSSRNKINIHQEKDMLALVKYLNTQIVQ